MTEAKEPKEAILTLMMSSRAKTQVHHQHEQRLGMLDNYSRLLAFIIALVGASPYFWDSAALIFLAVIGAMLPGIIFGWAYRAKQHAKQACLLLSLYAEMDAVRDPQWSDVDAFKAKWLRLGELY